jgi:hypothetical protein
MYWVLPEFALVSLARCRQPCARLQRRSRQGWTNLSARCEKLGFETAEKVMYVFICSLFNDAVSNSDCIASYNRVMVNWKECERNRSCPNLRYYLLGGAEESHANAQ